MNTLSPIGIAEFAKKSFAAASRRKPMIDWEPAPFATFVNEQLVAGNCHVFDAKGMPFCKYLFVPNFTGAGPSHHRIDNSNYQWLRSGYEARTEKELPVLIRWFDFPVPLEPAKWLMLILYSREQLIAEALEDVALVPEEEWSVISIMGLNEMVVPPMPPITMMRNALGISEGGNGVTFSREDYIAAADYWNAYAMVR